MSYQCEDDLFSNAVVLQLHAVIAGSTCTLSMMYQQRLVHKIVSSGSIYFLSFRWVTG